MSEFTPNTRKMRSWNYIDITGKRFGRLLVLKEADVKANSERVHWLCRCDCGTEKVVDGVHLRRGKTISCGCYLKEVSRERFKKMMADAEVPPHTTHGFSKSNLYKTWANIKTRCYNKNNKAYKWYGAKGVTMCNEWLNDFCVFKTWAEANGYKPGLTIDRINPFEGYFPENCRWVTIQEQRKTTRRYVQDHGVISR